MALKYGLQFFIEYGIEKVVFESKNIMYIGIDFMKFMLTNWNHKYVTQPLLFAKWLNYLFENYIKLNH